jgi:hypothetical protein
MLPVEQIIVVADRVDAIDAELVPWEHAPAVVHMICVHPLIRRHCCMHALTRWQAMEHLMYSQGSACSKTSNATLMAQE